MSQVHLGIDLGAESGRVVAGVYDGVTLDLHEIHRFPNKPIDSQEGPRWNFDSTNDGIWPQILKGLRMAKEAYGSAIRSVAVDSWAVDYGLLDREGKLLEQPFQYRNPRTNGADALVFEKTTKLELYQENGIQFLPFNTVFQWTVHNRQVPKPFLAADKVLLIPDLVNQRLCGSLTSEQTNASTTQCFDATTNQWQRALLGWLGVPDTPFPEVLEPGTLLGKVSPTLALGDWGVVLAPSHDTASAIVGVPAEEGSNWAFISSGTWSLVGMELANPIRTQVAMEANISNEAGFAGTTRFLKNVMGMWLLQGLMRENSGLTYAHMVTEAERAPAFAYLFDPDHSSLLAPLSMTRAINDLCTDKPLSNGELARAAMESLALKTAKVLERISAIAEKPVDVIHIVGGGSQNAALNQMIANSTGRTVVAGPVEATALGNILVQIYALGEFSTLAEMRELGVRVSRLQRFEPTDFDIWARARQTFDEICP